MNPIHVCRFTKAKLGRNTDDAEVMHFESILEHELQKAGYRVVWLLGSEETKRVETNGPELERVLSSFVRPLASDNSGWASHDYRVWNR